MTVQITGNDAQFNEKVTLLKDLEIYGNIKNIKKDISFDFSDDFSFKLQDNEKLNIANDNISFKTELNIKISNSYDIDGNGTINSSDAFDWNQGRFPSTVAIENSVKTAGIYLGDGDILRESAVLTQFSGGFAIFGRNSTYDHADNFISGMPSSGIRVGYSTGGSGVTSVNGLTIIKTKHDGNGAPVEILNIKSDSDNLIFKGENVGIGSDIPTSKLVVQGDAQVVGIVTANKFVGDGSGLTGVVGSGSGIAIKHDGAIIGTAGTINFARNLDVSTISGAAVTITASSSEYSVLDFGVVGDGSTDNTTAYSNLISTAPEGSTIIWPPGTYRGHFISTKSFNLIGGPNVILKPISDDSSNTNAILQFTGTEDSPVTLSAQPVFGSDQISHSSGTLAVGDIVRLWDGYGRPSDGQEVNKELVKVRVATNSGVTKIHGTVLSNQNNGTYTYVKLNTLKNIKIQNFRFELGTSTPAGIYCFRCENVENINIHVTGGKGASIYMRDVYNCYTSNTSRTDASDVSSGFGYHYQNYIVKYSRVEHTRGHVTRHVIDNDSTYMLSVKGAYATQSGGTPFIITHNSFGGFQHWENLTIENTAEGNGIAASADGLGQNTAAKRASEILRNITIKDYYDRSNVDTTNPELVSIYIQYQCKNLVLKDIVIIEDGTLSGNAADADIGQKAIRFSGPIGGSSSIQNVHAEGRPIVMMFDSDAQSGNHTYAQDFPRNGETLRIRNITCRTNIKKIFYFKSPANGSTGSYYMYFDIGDVRAMVGSSAFGTNGANWHSYVHIPSATTNGQGKFELDQIPQGMGTGANKVVVNSGGFLLYFHSLKNSMSASLSPTNNTLFQSDMISAGSPAGRFLTASTINVLEKPCGYGQVARFQCGGTVTFDVSAINASSGNADLSTVDGNDYIASSGDFIALVSLDADSWRIWKDGTWAS